jgi:putative transposase
LYNAELSQGVSGRWLLFFTVNLLHRQANDLLVQHINKLREAVRYVQVKWPFKVHGWVVLPDHFHCLIQLPENDSDYSLRLRMIKARFSAALPRSENRSVSRQKRGERGIWQRRYWEHLIRDDDDYRIHMDYIHINPVKHGLVKNVQDWPYSTFHKFVSLGVYPHDWAGTVEVRALEIE